MTKSNTLGKRFVRRVYQKMLTRGFKRKQGKRLKNWLKEYEELNPDCFEGVPRDPRKLEAYLTELNDKFFEWLDKTHPYNPRNWK